MTSASAFTPDRLREVEFNLLVAEQLADVLACELQYQVCLGGAAAYRISCPECKGYRLACTPCTTRARANYAMWVDIGDTMHCPDCNANLPGGPTIEAL